VEEFVTNISLRSWAW